MFVGTWCLVGAISTSLCGVDLKALIKSSQMIARYPLLSPFWTEVSMYVFFKRNSVSR